MKNSERILLNNEQLQSNINLTNSLPINEYVQKEIFKQNDILNEINFILENKINGQPTNTEENIFNWEKSNINVEASKILYNEGVWVALIEGEVYKSNDGIQWDVINRDVYVDGDCGYYTVTTPILNNHTFQLNEIYDIVIDGVVYENISCTHNTDMQPDENGDIDLAFYCLDEDHDYAIYLNPIYGISIVDHANYGNNIIYHLTIAKPAVHNNIEDIAYGGGIWLAYDDTNNFYQINSLIGYSINTTPPNAVDATAQTRGGTLPPTPWNKKPTIKYGNNTFVAYLDSGLYYSKNGLEWIPFGDIFPGTYVTLIFWEYINGVWVFVIDNKETVVKIGYTRDFTTWVETFSQSFLDEDGQPIYNYYPLFATPKIKDDPLLIFLLFERQTEFKRPEFIHITHDGIHLQRMTPSLPFLTIGDGDILYNNGSILYYEFPYGAWFAPSKDSKFIAAVGFPSYPNEIYFLKTLHNLWFVESDQGLLYYSNNGANWYPSNFSTASTPLINLYYFNGVYILTSNNDLYYSKDGENWKNGNLAQRANFIEYNDSTWIANTPDGIYYSTRQEEAL